MERGTRNVEREGEEAKRKIRRERLHSSEVNFIVNYNSGKVWAEVCPRCILRQAILFVSFPFFAPSSTPFPLAVFSYLPFPRGANLHNIQAELSYLSYIRPS